jgi:hypothetical protein
VCKSRTGAHLGNGAQNLVLHALQFYEVSVCRCCVAESDSYVTTDGQSASLSWNKAPIWGLRPDFYYCQTVADLLMWGALSDKRTGLSFTTAAGPRKRSRTRVRVPWNSRPSFTVSDSRLPFSSSTTTRWATVEVFDPASTGSAALLHTVLLIISRHGPHRKRRSSIVALVSVAAETCLPSRCLETGCITPFFYCYVRVCCGRYLAMAAVYRVTD